MRNIFPKFEFHYTYLIMALGFVLVGYYKNLLIFTSIIVIHELGHCVMFSYSLLPELHRMVKKRYWVDAEEFVCNILADYGQFVVGTARDILGNQFAYVAPIGAERMIA